MLQEDNIAGHLMLYASTRSANRIYISNDHNVLTIDFIIMQMQNYR